MTILATLALGFGLAFAESGLGLGMLVPGETAVVVLAATMRTPTDMLMLGICVMVGACLGDHVGYLLGRRYGDRLRDTRVVSRLGRSHFDRATDLLHRRGGLAVFMTRLVPIVRTLTPAAAGAAGLEYRRFLPASLAGSALWAGAYVGGGSIIATAAAMSQDVLGDASWLVLVLVALAAMPAVVIRAFTGVRPTFPRPDLMSFETNQARHRRAAFSPLIGDVQA